MGGNGWELLPTPCSGTALGWMYAQEKLMSLSDQQRPSGPLVRYTVFQTITSQLVILERSYILCLTLVFDEKCPLLSQHTISRGEIPPKLLVACSGHRLPSFTSLRGLGPGHRLFYWGMNRPLAPVFTLGYGWLAKYVGSCCALVSRDCQRSEVFLVQPGFVYRYIPKPVPLPVLGQAICAVLAGISLHTLFLFALLQSQLSS